MSGTFFYLYLIINANNGFKANKSDRICTFIDNIFEESKTNP